MIYIVRHGQTDWNKEGRNQGRTDIDINENGKQAAEEVKEKLKDINFDIVFSSPLKRAYHTAQIITDHKIITDERLIERCNGTLEGKLKNEYQVDFSDVKETRFGIEPLLDFQSRINNFLEEILEKYPNKNILIVTHAGVSIYIKCFFEGEPQDKDYSKYKLKNCEVLTYKN